MHVCLEPGCPTLTPWRRCSKHERTSSRNHCGIPRQARGLGAAHDRARRDVLGGACVLKFDGCTGIATTLEHLVPRSMGGTLEDGYAGACAHCQRVQGGRLAAPTRMLARHVRAR